MPLVYDVYLAARIPADLAASLEQFANAHEVSSASVVRAALREYIGCKKSPLPRIVASPEVGAQALDPVEPLGVTALPDADAAASVKMEAAKGRVRR